MLSPSRFLAPLTLAALATAVAACGSTQAAPHGSGSSGSHGSGSTGAHVAGSSTTGTSTTGTSTSGTTSSSTTTSTSGLTTGTTSSTTTTASSTTTTGTTSSTTTSSTTTGTTTSSTTTSSTTTSSSGSTGGGSTPICGTCAHSGDCQSGFCNTFLGGTPFCDYGTDCTECGSYGCEPNGQYCQCPGVTTTSSSGSTGTTTGGSTTGSTTSGSGSTGTTGAPAGWTCNATFYGDGSCDCGCGVVDVDCADATATSCKYCTDTGSCSKNNGGCAVINATDNALCTGTSGSTGTTSSGSTGTTSSGSTGTTTSSGSTSGTTGATYAGLVFTEYVTGVSNNKALEIANGTGATVNLRDVKVIQFSNGSTSPSATLGFDGGTLADHTLMVVCNSSASNTTLTAACNVLWGGLTITGNDVVELVWASDGGVMDSIGQLGVFVDGGWSGGGVSTYQSDLRRNCSTAADTNPTNAFDPSVNYSGFVDSDYSDFGNWSCP